MKQPKKHHRVPRTYLANFCGSDERLWVYELGSRQPRPSIPLNEAVETDLYSVIRSDGTRDTRIEDALAAIEGAGAPALMRLIEGAKLSEQERFDVSTLVASIHLRSDTMRQQYANFEGRTLAQAGRLLVSHDGAWAGFVRKQAELGKTLTDIDRETQREFINDPSRYEIHLRKDGLLIPLGMIETVADLVFKMRWSIMKAPEGEFFVTSDNPAVLFIAGPDGYSLYRGGFGSKGAEFSVPLSPSKVLLAHWIDDVAEEHLCARETVRNMNRMRASHAERAVYADRSEAGILRLVQKYLKPAPEPESHKLRVRMVRPRRQQE